MSAGPKLVALLKVFILERCIPMLATAVAISVTERNSADLIRHVSEAEGAGVVVFDAIRRTLPKVTALAEPLLLRKCSRSFS